MSGNSEPLFGTDKRWQFNACVDCYAGDWELYSYGYKEAADVLLREVSENTGKLDSFVYPIVFLYRQYLELRLKSLAYKAALLLDNSQPMPVGHKLNQLWAITKAHLEAAFPDQDVWQLDVVEQVVQEFESLDPNSTVFRYPEKLDGKPSLAGVRHINVAQFYERFEAASEILEGAATAVGDYLQAKWDSEQSEGN